MVHKLMGCHVLLGNPTTTAVKPGDNTRRYIAYMCPACNHWDDAIGQALELDQGSAVFNIEGCGCGCYPPPMGAYLKWKHKTKTQQSLAKKLFRDDRRSAGANEKTLARMWNNNPDAGGATEWWTKWGNRGLRDLQAIAVQLGFNHDSWNGMDTIHETWTDGKGWKNDGINRATLTSTWARTCEPRVACLIFVLT